MARKEFEGNRLFDLYARYVGEPGSRKDVYGYWTFIVGYLVGFAGVVAFLLGPDGDFVLREVSIALAALGLPVGLLGIVLMLPVRKRGIQGSLGGAVVALVAVGGFVFAYPANWGAGAVDYSSAIIAVYGVGVALVGGVAALVPVVTGERSLFFEPKRELEGDHPAVMIGEAARGALFAVYRNGADWTWRLIEQDALAGSVNEYLSRLETEENVEYVKEKVRAAGLLEIKHAAFRLYEAGDGWRWLLMRDDGSVVADSGDEFETRDAAAGSVSDLKEYGPDAPIIHIEGAAFDLEREDGGWWWRLIDEDRGVVARSQSTFGSRDDAEAAMERVAAVADEAGELAVEQYGVELFEADDGWRWRLLDAADADVATGVTTYDSRSTAESAVYRVLDGLADASVIDAHEPAYEIYENGTEWRWRLVTPDDDVIARSHDPAPSAADASVGAERLKADAGDADVVRIDDADFEYYRANDGWRWRLVTADREIVARSYGIYEDREAATRAVEEARTQALGADLIEFDESAFQLYEDGGSWRWRLIDEDGNVMADSGEEHETRDGAATSMMTVKEHAPDADLIEIETAAFEFFQNESGDWNWRLVDETGRTTTEGPTYYPTKEAAREAMDRLVERAEVADARAMERAAFQVYANGDEWRWRFVHPDGTTVADGEASYATRDEAETAIDETVRGAATVAPVHAVGSLAVQVYEDRGWRWRLVDGERAPVAESAAAHEERDDAAEAVRHVREYATDAAVFELRDPAFQLVGDDGEWRWRLIDEERAVLAVGPAVYEDREAARTTMDRARQLAPTADLVDFENAAFEIYEDDGEWRWRLIDEDEAVIGAGTGSYGSEEAAREAVERITAEVDDASILEIDTAAFEFHEDGGEWRWRLIDEDGNELAASLQAYPSRGEAREAMEFVREYAGEAMTSVAE